MKFNKSSCLVSFEGGGACRLLSEYPSANPFFNELSSMCNNAEILLFCEMPVHRRQLIG